MWWLPIVMIVAALFGAGVLGYRLGKEDTLKSEAERWQLIARSLGYARGEGSEFCWLQPGEFIKEKLDKLKW